jgi:asparagine synthase (glutamine-hydrolysing)
MAGIAGIVGGERARHDALLAEMSKSLTHSVRAKADLWSDSRAALCRVRSGNDNPETQPLFNRDRTRCIVMFGECFGYEQKKAELERQGHRFEYPRNDAEFCLKLYEAEGERGLAQLSGSYSFAIYDAGQGEVILVNDRLGSRSIFYGTTPDGRLIFSTQVSSVLCSPDISRELDVGAALEFCALQRVLGSKTYHKAVAVLPPASILRFRDGKVTVTPYWEMRYRPEAGSASDYAAELAATFKRTVSHVSRDGARVAMLLSGGLDARMVVAAADADLTCVTFGDYMNQEAEAAREIAAVRGFGFQFLQREPDHYVNLVDAAVELGGGMHAFNHAHTVGFAEHFQERFDVVTHGYAPELLFRGTSLPKVVRRLGAIEIGERLDPELNASNLAERIFSRGYSLLGKGFAELLTPLGLEVLMETLAGDARQMIAEASAASSDVYDQFLWPDVRYHARYPSMLFETSLRAYVTERSCVLHNEMLDLHLRLPRVLRSDSRLWVKALAKLDRRIARIRNANTGFSPMMPPSLAAMLETASAWATHLPLVWRLSNARRTAESLRPGVSPISWPRFDWLIRNNQALRQLITVTLSDPDALPPQYFDHTAIRRLVDDHLADRRQSRTILFALLTFGLWHKKYAFR